jgi:hypothetical protein
MKHLLCFTLAMAAPLFAGVRIQLDSTDLTTGAVTKQEILADAERLRFNETGTDVNRSILFLTDGGRNRIVILDKTRNEYREIDQQTMQQLSGQVSGQMAAAQAKMQEQMKNMTPEQRAMMEQMMKGRGMPGAAAAAPVRTVFTAKGSGTANGFACTKYEGDRGAEKVSEVCAANPADLKITASEIQIYEKMKEFSAGLQNMAANSPFAASVKSVPQGGFSGIPVQGTSFSDGKATEKTDAKSVTRVTLSNDDFSLGNAKKVELIPGPGRGKQ